MGNISFETFQKAVNAHNGLHSGDGKTSFTPAGQKKQASSGRTINFETFQKAVDREKAFREQERNAYLSQISRSDAWSSAADMDNYIQLTKDRAAKDTANKAVYDDILKSLESRKSVYGEFKDADEYNAAKQESEWREKYKGYTYDQIQQLIAGRSRRGMGDDQETEWLKRYGANVGYRDTDSYDKHLAALERRLKETASLYKDTISESAVQVSGYEDYDVAETEQKDKNIASLSQQKTLMEYEKEKLQRGKSVLISQQKLEEYKNTVAKAADFAEKSKFDDLWFDAVYRSDQGGITYPTAEKDEKLANQMYDDEKSIYAYIRKTQGEKQAETFFDELRPILNQRKNEEQAASVKAFADKNWFTATVANIGTLGSQLIDGTVGAPKKLIGSLTGDYEKNWAAYDGLTTFTNTVRTDTAQDLNAFFDKNKEDDKQSNTAGFIYNTLMSIADMGVALAAGGIVGKVAGATSGAANTSKIAKGVTQFIMSSEAASHTMTDARERGLSGWQIASLGVASAAIEAVTEKLPLDNLFAAKPSAWKAIVKQIATEGTEEAISSVLNTLADDVIAGNESAMKQQIANLMADGVSYQDAARQVIIDKAKEVGLDALGGALSGGIMGTGAVAIDRIANVHFSVPKKYTGTLEETHTWVADAFSKLKNGTRMRALDTVVEAQNGIKVKKPATVVLDYESMTKAVKNTKNADQAVAFAAVNDILHKGAVVKSNLGTAAVVHAAAMLNGNVHPVAVYLQKKTDTDWNVAGIAVDGENVYDASQYANESVADAESAAKFSVKTDVNGETFVDVEENIFENADGRSVASVIAQTISERFNNLINANGQNIQINAITNSEWRMSQSARDLLEADPDAYGDKMKSIANADEILREAKEWIGEKRTHDRTDNIVEFARGSISYRVGENGYSADVIVGIRNGGGAVLYDIVNISHKNITEAPVSRASAERHPSRQNASVTGTSVSQDGDKVNNQDLSNDLGDADSINYDALKLKPTALDRSFLSMSEEERAVFIERFERATGTRVVFDETLDASGKHENGVITVNPNIDTPMTVLIHELTHYIESDPSYADLFEYVFKSKAFASWLQEKGKTEEEMIAATIALREEKNKPLGASGAPDYEAQQEILGNFLGQKVIRDVNALAELERAKPRWFEKIRNWFANLIRHFRSTPMERELRKMEKMFKKAVQSSAGVNSAGGVEKYSFQGYAEDGRGKYRSNFPQGTPKRAKSERILRYIQNVWSKKPIRLKINEGGIERYIYAQFDPTYVETEGVHTDASKLMGGNRHGTASEQRVTLDLADDYYQIASEATYNYSKDETGKDHPAHKGVRKWHYFVNDIYFAEHGSDVYNPYRVSINVKEKADGKFVYSFSAEKIRGQDAPQTLHAVVSEGRDPNTNDLSSDPIKPQNGNGVNTQSMQNGAKYSVSPVVEEVAEAKRMTEAQTEEEDPLAKFSEEELYEEIRKRNPKWGPIDIARQVLEDANTTPYLESGVVENLVGDGDSSFYESVQNANIFKDELKTLAASNSTIMQYDRIGNQETMRDANAEINRKGRRYVGEFLHKASEDFTAKDVAAGFILMGRYNAVGDYRGAVLIAEKLREVGTRSGQTVQAFSILGRLTPEGMQLYAQRELHKAYEEMLKGQTNQWGRENKAKFELTDEDIAYIRRKVVQASQLPDGRDKYVRLGEIAARIQSKIPQVKGQGIKAFQRSMMLLNPKTNARNIFGNILMTPEFICSDFIGTGIDKMISKSTGVRTTSRAHLSAKAFGEGLFNSWDDFVRHINTRNFEGGRFDLEMHSLDNFSDRNAFTRALNTLDRVTSFLLDAGDRSFYQMWFINSLNGQMKANHVTEPTAAMIEIAMQDAKERTWQDDNTLTRTLSTMKNGLNAMGTVWGYGLGDVVFKFLKTPANISKAMIDFSPVGFAATLAFEAHKFSVAVKEGRATPQMQRAFVKHLSNGFTGTLASVLGYLLARAGLLHGKKDEDADVADFERNVLGIQPYSFTIGNKSFTFDWANPATKSLAVWADYFEDKRNAELTGEKREWYQNVIEAVKTGGQVLFDQSFMTSLRNLYGYDGPMDGIINILLQDPAAFAPQMLSQLAATIDPTVRTTTENGNDAKTAWNKILYKIPGARNTLAESVDVLGNTKTQYGNVWDRIFNNFLNPANVAGGYDSVAGDEIYRLYQTTGAASVIPSLAPNYVEVKGGGKLTLDSHQKSEYQKISGKMSAEAVEGLLKEEQYTALSDEKKVELLSNIYSYSKQVAKNTVTDVEISETYVKAHEIISQGVPAYEYFLLKSIADHDGVQGVKQEEARAVLDASSLTQKQKEIMWSGFNSSWKSNPYKKRYY